MSKANAVIGIDTSNYTTSVSVVTVDGDLIANLKKPLDVRHGERGLRQSDAVFAHIKNIPHLMDDVNMLVKDLNIIAVGVSDRPRNVVGSYMPCFLPGVSVASSLASVLNVPMYKFSHQCGHIMAALYSSGKTTLVNEKFYALHVSGGTTEILLANGTGKGFVCEIIGGTKDTSAGQIIDRVGVYLGMPFPAGKYLDDESKLVKSPIKRKKPSADGTYINLSGLENMAVKLYNSTGDKSLVSAFVLNYIADAIVLMCDRSRKKHGELPFVFAGGVMCNSLIRSKVAACFNAIFAEPSMSSDNAVGIAVLAAKAISDKA